MKRLFTIIFLLFLFSAQAQVEKDPKIEVDCSYNGRFSATERLKQFPFNLSLPVVLVSFEEQQKYKFVTGDHFDSGSFKETVYLTSEGVDSLTNVLYNFSVQGDTFSYTPAVCYVPRHAILFLGPKGVISEFIELCFECQRYRLSSENINSGISCQQKFDLLKTFFSRSGIKFATSVN